MSSNSPMDDFVSKIRRALYPSPEDIAKMPTEGKLGFLVMVLRQHNYTGDETVDTFLSMPEFASFDERERRLATYTIRIKLAEQHITSERVSLDEFSDRAHSLIEISIINIRERIAKIETEQGPHEPSCTCHLQTEAGWLEWVVRDLTRIAVNDVDHEFAAEVLEIEEMRKKMEAEYGTDGDSSEEE